jgi:uncharacterized Zn finger protein (UPF0148 family)
MDNPLKNFSLVIQPEEKSDTKNNANGLFVPGAVCPFCGQGILDYDGLLNLVCPVCGQREAGGCT